MTGSVEYIGGATGGIPESVFDIKAGEVVRRNVDGVSGLTRISIQFQLQSTSLHTKILAGELAFPQK